MLRKVHVFFLLLFLKNWILADFLRLVKFFWMLLVVIPTYTCMLPATGGPVLFNRNMVIPADALPATGRQDDEKLKQHSVVILAKAGIQEGGPGCEMSASSA